MIGQERNDRAEAYCREGEGKEIEEREREGENKEIEVKEREMSRKEGCREKERRGEYLGQVKRCRDF